MRKFGFKLFSTNLQTAPTFIRECAVYTETHNDMFIELMVVPTSTRDDLQKIKKQLGSSEVRIHAPHGTFGFDAGNQNLEQNNRDLFSLSQYAADIFESKTIIIHAGGGHHQKYVEETAHQLKKLNDKRIIVENLPYYTSKHDPLHGNTAEEIKYIMDESGCGFCFDFSHAICAAVSLNMDIETQLKSLYNLHPDVYHMCDGDITSPVDKHLHFQSGNYPLKHLLNTYTAQDAYITIETGKGIMQHNDLLIKDYKYLKSLQKHFQTASLLNLPIF